MSNYKQYLGDGVYADFDGYHIILETSNGISITNKIFIDPDVLRSLIKYNETLIDKIKEQEQ